MTGGSISLGDPFYRLVKPEAALTRESVIIHGIMPSEVAEEQDIASVLAEFMEFCGSSHPGRPLRGRSTSPFIEREIETVWSGTAWRCRCSIRPSSFPGWRGRRLLERCMKAMPHGTGPVPAVPSVWIFPYPESHHAMADAFITAQVFQRFLPLLAQEGISTVGDLITDRGPHMEEVIGSDQQARSAVCKRKSIASRRDVYHARTCADTYQGGMS